MDNKEVRDNFCINNFFDEDEDTFHELMSHIVNDAFYCKPENEKRVIMIMNYFITVLAHKRNIDIGAAFEVFECIHNKNIDYLEEFYCELDNWKDRR